MEFSISFVSSQTRGRPVSVFTINFFRVLAKLRTEKCELLEWPKKVLRCSAWFQGQYSCLLTFKRNNLWTGKSQNGVVCNRIYRLIFRSFLGKGFFIPVLRGGRNEQPCKNRITVADFRGKGIYYTFPFNHGRFTILWVRFMLSAETIRYETHLRDKYHTPNTTTTYTYMTLTPT